MRSVAIGVVVAGAGLASTFAAVGADRVWRVVGGDPDLGDVTFETLRRRATPNDALACPPGLGTARSDIVSPLYAGPARDLRRAFAAVLATEPRVVEVARDDAALTDRYIQRSAVLGFPDTVVVRFLDRPEGRSTLALYSRSKFGAGDLGVNRARIARWLGKLATAAPPLSVPPAP